MNQKDLDNYYMSIANICANNSMAKKLQVGAILVKDQQIISDGFNGTPKGFENDCEYVICTKNNKKCTFNCKNSINCEYKELKTKPYVIHAEANCLMKSLNHGNSTKNSTLYITHAPCIECAKLIIQAGVIRVVYLNDYKNTDGISILERSNIIVEKLSN